MTDLSGLVLSVQDYKERDGIVFVLTQTKIQSVYARGIQSAASKNRRLCNPFTKVDLIVGERRSGSSMALLIKGSVKAQFHKIQDSLVAQSACFVLRDILFRSVIHPEYEDLLFKVWQAFDHSEKSRWTYACLLLACILKNEGIAPDVSECVRCHARKGIETVSVADGGFLCVNCNVRQFPKWKKEDLEKLRSLFVIQPDRMDIYAQNKAYDLDDFLFLAKWYERYAAAELASIRFLNSVRSLG